MSQNTPKQNAAKWLIHCHGLFEQMAVDLHQEVRPGLDLMVQQCDRYAEQCEELPAGWDDLTGKLRNLLRCLDDTIKAARA